MPFFFNKNYHSFTVRYTESWALSLLFLCLKNVHIIAQTEPHRVQYFGNWKHINVKSKAKNLSPKIYYKVQQIHRTLLHLCIRDNRVSVRGSREERLSSCPPGKIKNKKAGRRHLIRQRCQRDWAALGIKPPEDARRTHQGASEWQPRGVASCRCRLVTMSVWHNEGKEASSPQPLEHEDTKYGVSAMNPFRQKTHTRGRKRATWKGSSQFMSW